MVINENHVEYYEGNVIDDYSGELNKLFERHKDKVPSLVNSANSLGYKFSTREIREIIGLNEKDAKYLKYALVALTHKYVSHHEELRQHASTSKLDKSVIDDLFLFLSKLDEVGLKGLDTLFYSEASLETMPVISEMTDPT